MQKRLYTVFDTVAGTIVGEILQAINDPPAIRAFHDALKTPNSLIGQHPADFQLLNVGIIDDDGAIYIQDNGRTVVATGAAWLESQKAAAYTNQES